jgi:hypothetical protein
MQVVACGWSMLSWVLVLWFTFHKETNAARFHVVGPQEQEQMIRLKSQYDIGPSTLLSLPIDVPQESISLYGKLPPRLKSITSTAGNEIYGTGDVLYVDFTYTANVQVTGTPTITLNTGCASSDSSCTTKEIQAFVCVGDQGSFGLQLNGEYVMNLDALTTRDELKYKLEEIQGVEEVTIGYGEEDDREYSMGNRICTSKGNNVTITFENVTFAVLNNNVPTITYDVLNQFAHARTGISQGVPDSSLAMTHSTSSVSITSEILQEGFRKENGMGYYISGSNTSTIRFAFTVEGGDSTTALDVLSLNMDENSYIASANTGAIVSSQVPLAGQQERYMFGSASQGSALSYGNTVQITTDMPQITGITSPNPDGTYTEGDQVTIYIVYDLPVKIYNPSSLTLRLAVSPFERTGIYQTLINDTTLSFLYTVDSGDTKSLLDLIDSDSLVLGTSPAAVIYRKANSNTTLANITVPILEETGSLPLNKKLTINTANPLLLDIEVLNSIGTYTAGDSIDLKLTFDNAISVTGQPRVWLNNNQTSLNTYVRSAPASQTFTHARAEPGRVAQYIFSFRLNWALSNSDTISVTIPGTFMVGVSGTQSLSVSGGNQSLISSATYTDSSETFVFTLNNNLNVGERLTFSVDGLNSIRVPAIGILEANNMVRYSIGSSSSVTTSFTSNYAFEALNSVGMYNTSLAITPSVAGVKAELYFTWQTPEILLVGDTIEIECKGFTAPFVGMEIIQKRFEYDVLWNSYTERLIINVTTPVGRLQNSVNVTLMTPITGIDHDTIALYTNSSSNGDIIALTPPYLTRVCAVQNAKLKYTTATVGSASAIEFTFSVGPTSVKNLTQVEFKLPTYDSTIAGTNERTLDTYLSGNASAYFTAKSTANSIFFTYNGAEYSGEIFSLTISSSAGFPVPTQGIRVNSTDSTYDNDKISDSFGIKISSSACIQSDYQYILYARESAIQPIYNPIWTFYGPSGDVPIPYQPVYIQFEFGLVHSLLAGDTFIVDMPGYNRSTELDTDNVWFVQNTPWNVTDVGTYNALTLSARWDASNYELEFTVLTPWTPPLTYLSGGTPKDNSTITITLNQYSGFYFPQYSVLPTAHTLTLNSNDGGKASTTLVSDCNGFCSANVAYSSPIVDEEVTMTLTLYFNHTTMTSTSSTHNLVVNYQSLELYTGGVNPTATISFDGGLTYSSLTQSVDTTEKTITITGGINPTSANGNIIVVSGLKFSLDTPALINSGLNKGPIVDVNVDRSTVGADNYVARYAYDVPIVYPSITLSAFGLAFSSNVAGASSDLVLSIAVGSGTLEMSYSVKIQLYQFTCTSPTVTGYTVTWDSTNTILTLSSTTTALTSSSGTVTATISGCKTPEGGVSSTSTMNNDALGYAIQYVTNVQSAYRDFTSIGEVTNVNANVLLSFNDFNDFTLKNITLNVESSSALSTSDNIVVEFYTGSRATVIEHSSITTDTALTVNSDSTLTATAAWTFATRTLTATMSGNQAANNYTLFIDTANTLIMAPWGIWDNSPLLITLTIGGNSFSVTTPTLPCVGICSATMTPSAAKAGYAVAYDVSISLSGRAYQDSDTFKLYLPDFTLNSNSAGTGATFTYQNDFQYTWDSVTETLLVALQSGAQTTSTWVGNRTTVTFKIPQDYLLELPTNGIRQGTPQSLNISWSNTASDFTMNSDNLVSGVVGQASASSFTIDDKRASADSNLTFSLTLTDALSVNDKIYIQLEDFTVPNKTLTVYPLSVGVVMTCVGETGYTSIDSTDNSQTKHLAQIICTILQNTAASTVMTATIVENSNVLLPNTGVYGTTVPRFAIESTTSPIATSDFATYTKVGSFEPSELIIPQGTEGEFDNITVKFTSYCPLIDTEIISIKLPHLTATDDTSVSVTWVDGTYYGTPWTGEWQNTANTLILTLSLNGTTPAIRTGIMTLLIETDTDKKFSRNTNILYPNDTRLGYTVTSTECGVSFTSFKESEPNLLKSSSLTFESTALSSNTGFHLTFTPTIALARGDKISLSLPGHFDTSGMAANTGGVFVNNATSTLNTQIESIGLWNTATQALEFTLAVNVSSYNSISVAVNESLGLKVGAVGVNEYDDFPLTVIRPHLSDLILFTGNIDQVEKIGNFRTASVIVDTPIPGSNTGLTITWALSGGISIGEEISVMLPGYVRDTNTYSSSISSSIELDSSSLASEYVTASWMPTTTTMAFIAYRDITNATTITAVIASTQGFLNPTAGVSSTPTISMTISSNAINAPVSSQTISTFSIVPVMLDSTVSFISSDKQKRIVDTYNAKSIQLLPGHPFNALDNGTIVSIQDKLYTVTSVDGDFLNLLEDFNGTTVFLGKPETILSTSPIRPAYYMSGADGTELTFRYLVRRGDNMTSIATQDPLYSPYISSTIDVSTGALLRKSQNPSVAINTKLPYSLYNENYKINTMYPLVQSVSSSTQEGTYSEGDQVDFKITFSNPVIVELAAYTVPTLLLKVAPTQQQIAYYASGSGTDTLVFVYNVTNDDAAFHPDEELISTLTTNYPQHYATSTSAIKGPIFEPLRIITGGYEESIRRVASIPILDVDTLSFTADSDSTIPRNISMVGVSPKVSSKWASTPTQSTGYTVGDTITVYIKFDAGVRVWSPDAYSLPFITLETGNTLGPQKAIYSATSTTTVTDDTISFVYTIQKTDNLASPGGLYLHCDCDDYFNRTFIHLNSSRIPKASGFPYQASVVLASNSSNEARLIDSSLIIDTTTTTVQSIASNITTGATLIPGDVMSIDVTFSTNVTVRGIIRLRLNGGSSDMCYARLASGNNSNILTFDYMVTDGSGTARVECDRVEAIDLTGGQIMRRSDISEDDIDASFPRAGSVLSMGMNTDISVNTELVQLTSVDSKKPQSGQSKPYLSTRFLSTTLYLDERLQAYTTYLQEDFIEGSIFYSNSSTIIDTILTKFFEYPINVFVNDILPSADLPAAYQNKESIVYIEDSSKMPFLSTPAFIKTDGSMALEQKKNWQELYNVQSVVDIDVAFDRPVLASEGSTYIQVNTHDTILNKAYNHEKYRSTIEFYVDTAAVSMTEQQAIVQYQISYMGYVTRCLSVMATSQGPHSLQEALEEIWAIRRLGITVSMSPEDRSGLSSSRWRLFNIHLERPANGDFIIKTASNGASCTNNANATSVYEAPSKIVSYRYPIREANSIVFEAQTTIPAGVYNLSIDYMNGLSVSPFGILPNSMRMDHISQDGTIKSSQLIDSQGVPQIAFSSIQFSSKEPNTVTSIEIHICMAEKPLSNGDTIEVTLPGFGGNNDVLRESAATLAPNATYSAWEWFPPKETLVFTLNLDADDVCLKQKIPDWYGFILPSQGNFQNSPDYRLKVVTANQGVAAGLKVDYVDGIGLSEMSIVLSELTPGRNTSVNITFGLATDLKVDNPNLNQTADLYFRLPGFFKDKDSTRFLDISGPYAHHFIAEWENNTDSVRLLVQHTLEAGIYYVFIEEGEMNALRISEFGMGPEHPLGPPTVNVSSSSSNGWNMLSTIYPSYPRILGLTQAYLEIDVHRPYHHVLSATLSLNFTRAIFGPASIYLYMPMLTHNYGGYQSTSIATGRTQIWREYDKTFEFKRDAGYIHDNGSLLINFDTTDFMMNSLGIPYSDNTPIDNLIRIAIKGHESNLDWTPIKRVQYVPMIQQSSIRFNPEVFAINSSMTITLTLNMPAKPGDQFFIDMHGVEGAYYTNRQNVTFVGDCAAMFPDLDRYHNDTVLRITIDNSSNICQGDSTRGFMFFNWTIPAANGLTAPKKVNQVNTNMYKVQWDMGEN